MYQIFAVVDEDIRRQVLTDFSDFQGAGMVGIRAYIPREDLGLTADDYPKPNIGVCPIGDALLRQSVRANVTLDEATIWECGAPESKGIAVLLERLGVSAAQRSSLASSGRAFYCRWDREHFAPASLAGAMGL